MPEFIIKIDKERCKGCGLCIEFCPRKVLTFSAEINRKGYHPPQPSSPENCTGCLSCILVCPDLAIDIFRKESREVSV